MNSFITEISEEDFRKLNLVGYKHIKVSTNEKAYRWGWEAISLNEVLDEEKKNFNKWLTNEPKCIIIAIHSDFEKAIEYEEIWNKYPNPQDFKERRNLPEGFYFVERFGCATYTICDGYDKLYSKGFKWFTWDKQFEIDKRTLKAIYIIHLENMD